MTTLSVSLNNLESISEHSSVNLNRSSKTVKIEELDNTVNIVAKETVKNSKADPAKKEREPKKISKTSIFEMLPEGVKSTLNKMASPVNGLLSRPDVDQEMKSTGLGLRFLMLPVAIYSLGKSIFELHSAVKKKDKEEKDKEKIVDKVFDVLEGIGATGEKVCSLALGLGSTNAFVSSFMKHIPVIGAVFAAFEGSGAIKLALNAHQTGKQQKAFKAVVASQDVKENFPKAIDYIKGLSPDQVEKTFGKTQEWMLEKLEAIEPDDVEKQEIAITAIHHRIRATRIKQAGDATIGHLLAAGSISAAVPMGQVASPWFFGLALVTAAVKDGFSWYSKSSFEYAMDGMGKKERVKQIAKDVLKKVDKEFIKDLTGVLEAAAAKKAAA